MMGTYQILYKCVLIFFQFQVFANFRNNGSELSAWSGLFSGQTCSDLLIPYSLLCVGVGWGGWGGWSCLLRYISHTIKVKSVFKVYTLVVFSMFTEVCSDHYNQIFRPFSTLQKEISSPLAAIPTPRCRGFAWSFSVLLLT